MALDQNTDEKNMERKHRLHMDFLRAVKEQYGRNTDTKCLLKREWKTIPPPRYGYNKVRNTFEIPFQTEEYKDWWSAGPSSFGKLQSMELRQTDLDSDDSDYDIDSDDDIFVPGFATSWIAPYLLELELNEKEPPYLAFKEYRGLDNLFHFKIQFKTEIYQKWWDTKEDWEGKLRREIFEGEHNEPQESEIEHHLDLNDTD